MAQARAESTYYAKIHSETAEGARLEKRQSGGAQLASPPSPFAIPERIFRLPKTPPKAERAPRAQRGPGDEP